MYMMCKKNLIGVGIVVSIALACFAGYTVVHNKTEAVETMAENSVEIVAEESFETDEEEKKEQLQTTETVDKEETESITDPTEQETDILQENEVETEENVKQEYAEQEEKEQEIVEKSEEESIDEIDIYMYTTADVNMRKDYTTQAEVIKVVPYGTKIHVTGVCGNNWYRIDAESVGYISGKFLSAEEPVMQAQQNQQTELERQAAENQKQFENMSQQEIYDYIMNGLDELGYKTGEDANDWKNLPSSEYNGDSVTSNILHAE